MNSVLVRHKWEPYIWLLPSILLMTIFVVFPIGIVFKLAFSEISKAGIVGGFVGFANFKEAVSAPVFGTVMLNTVVWVGEEVGLSTRVGFIIAMRGNKKFLWRIHISENKREAEILYAVFCLKKKKNLNQLKETIDGYRSCQKTQ